MNLTRSLMIRLGSNERISVNRNSNKVNLWDEFLQRHLCFPNFRNNFFFKETAKSTYMKYDFLYPLFITTQNSYDGALLRNILITFSCFLYSITADVLYVPKKELCYGIIHLVHTQHFSKKN